MRIAVVVPRYDQNIAGGAEALGRGLAEEMARRGWDVEVWTTCVRNHYTWENEYPAGRFKSQGLTIHRFPVTIRHADRRADLESRLATHSFLPLDDQYAWLEGGIHCIPLYAHIAEHAVDFDAVLVLPYPMPLTQMAAWAAPDRVIMWPCLHNEPYAYMEPLRLLLEHVRGIAFNSPEEQILAAEQVGIQMKEQAVLGVGVTTTNVTAITTPSTRSLLYIGRLERGKNVTLLYEYVRRYADNGGDIHLTVIGSGPLEPPQHPAFEYRGFVSEEEKATLCASTLALCQPSLNESFSITIMEAWLAGRPVLVHQDCAVTRGHAQRSKGGLWFRSYNEFVGAVQWLQRHAALANQMGQNGNLYVHQNYTWKRVVDRFGAFIMRLNGE